MILFASCASDGAASTNRKIIEIENRLKSASRFKEKSAINRELVSIKEEYSSEKLRRCAFDVPTSSACCSSWLDHTADGLHYALKFRYFHFHLFAAQSC